VLRTNSDDKTRSRAIPFCGRMFRSSLRRAIGKARSAAATEYRQISRRPRVLTRSGQFAGTRLHLRPYGDTRKLAVPPDDGITTGIGTWRVVDLSAPRDGAPRLKFVCCYGSRLRSSKITHCALSPSGDASPSSTTLRCGFFPGCGICAASGAISSP